MNVKFIICCWFATCLFLPNDSFAADAPAKNDICSELEGFVIIGETEYVSLTGTDLRLKARIDTGATTSSIGMLNPERFERDGKKWIRFSIKDPKNDKLIDFEKPIERIAQIKRHGAAPQERPVVLLKISLAKLEMERQFTLTDRSKYTYPVLIGRNVLQGKYVVDVNRKDTTQKRGDTEE